MKFMNKCSVFVAALIITYNTQAQTAIELFTDAPTLIAPISGSRVEIVHYDLSEVDRLKRTSLPVLPPNKDEAMRIATAFFNSPEGEAFKREMMVAGRGQKKLFEYQLKKIPAVVFDHGKYVVYGTTDVATARQMYLLRSSQGAPK
jgi:integrating conjugative element protein (TIGR03757 family)